MKTVGHLAGYRDPRPGGSNTRELDMSTARSILLGGKIRHLGLGILCFGSMAYAQLPETIDLGQPPGGEGAVVSRIYSPSAAYSSFGMGDETVYQHGLALGDFNGDGISDLAIGAGDEMDAFFNKIGCIYIFFGKESGLGLEVDLQSPPADLARIFGPETEQDFGRSLTAGDINGDGIDDLVVGNLNLANCSDGLYVVYGRTGLSGETLQLPTALQLESMALPDYMSTICGGTTGFGHVMAIGDFDADGLDDIAAVDATSGSYVNLIFGDTLGPGARFDLDYPPTEFSDVGDVHIPMSLAAGDVNGDGFDDLAIGRHMGISSSWEVRVVHGRAALKGTRIDVDTAATGVTSVHGYDFDPNDGMSFVTFGDLDGDGLDDLVVSTEHDGQRPTNILYGADLANATLVHLNDPAQCPLRTTLSDASHVDNSTYYPYVPAAGDFNGDGLDDLVLGGSEYDSGAWPGGRAYGLYGATTLHGLDVDLIASAGDVLIAGAASTTQLFAVSTVAGGDLNNDGVADLAFSAPHHTNLNPDNSVRSVGRSFVVYGAGTGDRATATEYFRAGDAPERGFGGALSPVLRAWLAFLDGDTAPTTATITRNVDDIENFETPALLANVTWSLSTTRTGWSAAEVRFRYLDVEVAGLVESSLGLFQAPTPDGPWTEVAAQALDADRNEIRATVNAGGHFVIAEKANRVPAVQGIGLVLLCALLVLSGWYMAPGVTRAS